MSKTILITGSTDGIGLATANMRLWSQQRSPVRLQTPHNPLNSFANTRTTP